MNQPDIFGIFQDVLLTQKAEDGPYHVFVSNLVDTVLSQNGFSFPQPFRDEQRSLLVDRIRQMDLSLRSGRTESIILEEAEQILDDGIMPVLVELFVERGEISADRFTPHIKRLMSKFLLNRGFETAGFDQAKINQFMDGDFDEHFVVAYDWALSRGSGRDDPIDSIHVRNPSDSLGTWDFTVNEFEDLVQQGIIRENILAAGVLSYCYELGERMGIFDIAKGVVVDAYRLNRDIGSEVTTNRILRYYKLLDDRTSDEERGMLYRRILNLGGAQLLSGMVDNTSYSRLKETLLKEVVEYIEKEEANERGRTEDSPVSRSPIYNAINEIQYNLTDNCPGMAIKQIQEVHAQLEEAIELLSDSDIVDHYGNGRRKTMWSVLEQQARELFGKSLNVASIRTLAVEVYRMHRFIAEFDASTVTDDAFFSFLDSAEAYILAMANVESSGELDHESEEFEDEEFDSFDNDFEDEEF